MAPPTSLSISGFSLLVWANHCMMAQETHQSPLLGPQHWLISLPRIRLAAHLIPRLGSYKSSLCNPRNQTQGFTLSGMCYGATFSDQLHLFPPCTPDPFSPFP